MSNFVKQVKKLYEKYGRPLTIDELEECRKSGELKFEKEGSIDEYAFVHITDFGPENDKIESNNSKLENGQIKRESTFENFKRTERRNPTEEDIKNYNLRDDEFVTAKIRNKVHLTVNGKVLSHAGGNWDIRKYGIIIPARDFIKDNKDEIYSVEPEDSFVRGNVKARNGILLCPQSDYDVLHELNPNALIIPVNEENVINVADGNNIDCVKRLLQLMDIETKECAEHGWMKDGRIQSEDTKIFQEIIRKEMGRAPMVQDRYSILKFEEAIQNCVSIGVSIYDPSKMGNLKGKEFFLKPGKTEQELSEKQLKGSIKRIDDILVEKGMSSLQIFEQSYDEKEYDDRYYKRIEENEQIEEYLGISLKEMYDGNMITTNAKRIKMIQEKMKEEGQEKNPIAEKAFEACVKHDKRIDMEGFDFEKYSKEVDKSVLDLGINLEMMDEKNIFKQISEEVDIQKFLRQQGYIEEPSIELSQRSVNRLKFVYDVMYKSAIKDYKSGQLDTDEWGTIPNGETFKESGRIEKLLEEKLEKRLHEMETSQEIISELEEIGISVSRIGKIDSDEKEEQMIELAEMQAKQEQQQQQMANEKSEENLDARYFNRKLYRKRDRTRRFK